MDLLLTSSILEADECLRIGLVEKVVPKETAYEDTLKWTLDRICHHYSVTRALKQIAVKTDIILLEKSLKFERNIFCPFWGSDRNKLALDKKIKHL